MLGMLGEMIVKELSKDNLDDKQKATRDQFLDHLEVRIKIVRYCL